MKRRQRINYSKEDIDLMWERWRQGDTLNEIGALFDRHHTTAQRIISAAGGIQPAKRKRSSRTLSLCEREEISRGLAQSLSLRLIAKKLDRSPSTISREIARNGGCGDYRATKADSQAWDNARRPKECKLAINKKLTRVVIKKLRSSWSPEQIAGSLKKQYPDDEFNRVSHETIYKTLYVQTRGALKKELMSCLRSNRHMRHSKHATKKGLGQGTIPNLVSISERPPSVEDRAIPGHWEGDLIVGSNNSYIATLVERQTRYLMLVKLEDSKAETVASALIKHSKKLPSELYKSLTWDRGREMKSHEKFTIATDIEVYFCDPSSPWQRGSNENTNRLLRQYYPKGTDLSVYSQKELNAIARQLNERPRKTLGFDTPAERFNACVASIH